jgi:hypothetical protein
MKLFKVRVGEKYVAAYYRDNKKATTTCYTFLQIKQGDRHYQSPDFKYYRVLELTTEGLKAVPYEVSIDSEEAYVYPNGADIYTSLAKGFVEFLTGMRVVPSNDAVGIHKFYLRDKD